MELKILKPYILKSYFSGDLAGEMIEDIVRRGKYLIFLLTSYKIYVHLMLHGSIRYIQSSAEAKKSAAALLVLKNGAGIEFSEKTAKKRMAIYIIPKDEGLTRIENLGIEPLSEEFTVQELSKLVNSDRRQLKSFLCRQNKIAGIGNAYADEILWRAGLSPFRLSANITASEIKRLHRAIREVLEWAIQEVKHSRRLDKRDFLHVHGKKDGRCPRCGDTIRIVSFAQSDTFYCPKCQTSGKRLKDRRMSKFFR
jgi:formamidopyrimidine-DNA glycosylase